MTRPPERLFRYGSWVFFTLLLVGFALAAITGDTSVMGPFLILAGLLQATLALALVVDYRGIRGRLRGSDYPPGIYFVVNPLWGKRGTEQQHRSAGVAGLAVSLIIVAVGIAAIAGVVDWSGR